MTTEHSPIQIEHSYNSVCIEDAAIQAAMQPWVIMECYQLSPGKQLAHMETLDNGAQQVVRETQLAAVQKVGTTPAGLCTLSYCTADPSFRFSDLGADNNTIFLCPSVLNTIFTFPPAYKLLTSPLTTKNFYRAHGY